jgi:hypothetical protein
MIRPPQPWQARPGLVRHAGLWRGLVGCWPFWEGGGDVIRSVATGRDQNTGSGTFPDWASGQYGKHLNFASASSEYIDLPDATGVGTSDAHSFLVVFRTSSAAAQTLYAEGKSSTNNTICMAQVRPDISGNLRYNLRGDASSTFNRDVDIGSGYGDGEWHTAIFSVRDQINKKWTFMVDGAEPSITDNSHATAPGARILDNIHIGVLGRTSRIEYMDGDIALVATWDRGLAVSEMRALSVDPWAMLRGPVRRFTLRVPASIQTLRGSLASDPMTAAVGSMSGLQSGTVLAEPVLEWVGGVTKTTTIPLEWFLFPRLQGSLASDPMTAATGRLTAETGRLRGLLASNPMRALHGNLRVSTPVDVQPPVELQALSVWTDFEAAGGTLESVFTPAQILACEEVVGLDGEEKLTATVQRSAAAWSDLVPGKVLRAEFQTGDYDEWRVRSLDSASAGAATGTITCEGPIYDLLRRSGLVEVTESDGFTDHDLTISNLTPSQWYDLAADSPNFPSWVAKGMIEPTTRVTIPIDGDPPLRVFTSAREALDTLNEQKPNLRLRRVGTLEYRLDLLTERGSSAELAFVGSSVNLASMSHRESADELVTQIYLFGGGAEGSRLSMQHHRFKLANVTGTTVDLAAPDGSSEAPIKIDDIVNDLWLENVTRDDSAQITDSAVTNNRLTFSAVPGTWANDDLVVVRRNAALDGLNFIEHPANRATYGSATAKAERRDIAGVDNLMTNPMLTQALVGGVPPGWTAIGSPTLTAETNRPWWLHGGGSLKIVARPGEGVETTAITIDPTVTNPFMVAQVWLIGETLVSGHKFKVQIEDVTNGGLFPNLGNDASVLQATLAPTMVPVLTGINWQRRGTTQVKIRVTVEGQGNAQSTLRLDAAQLFRGVNPAAGVHEGYASNRLWSLAQDVLLGQKGTPVDAFDVDVTDLYRLDQTAYPHAALEIGGTVIAKDEALGVDIQTRIVKRTRNLLVAGETTVTLSDKRRDLVGMIGKRPIRAVIDSAPPISGDPVSSGRGLLSMNVMQGATISAPVGREFIAGSATAVLIPDQLNTTEGDLVLLPFSVSNDMTIDQLSFFTASDQVGTFSPGPGTARVGIYRDTGQLLPGNIVYQSGDVTIPLQTDTTVAWEERTVTGLSIDLEPGIYYWVALQCTSLDAAASDTMMWAAYRAANLAPASGDLPIKPVLGLVSDPATFPTSSVPERVYAIGIRYAAQGGTMPNPAPTTGEAYSWGRRSPTGDLDVLETAGPYVKLRRSA